MSDDNHNIDNADLNRLLGVMAVIVAVMFAIAAYAWLRVPDGIRIPVHWGLDGKPNRFGGKAEGLLVMPCIALATTLLFRVIPIIEPRRRNLLRSFVAYRMVALGLVTFFLVIYAVKVGNILGVFKLEMTSVVGLLVSALIMVLGNYLGKVRSNFMFGIRTPWTLSSNIAWDKTHRLGGRLFFGVGLIGLIASAAMPASGIKVFIGLLIAASMFLVFYSWLVWRNAPDRTQT
ncbi:MAG TPA: SdpI family protein [Pseudomonadales bacterium]|nr:SdpI family protein [Pseudomonadales bacterium]